MKLHLSSFKIPSIELFESLVKKSAAETKLGFIVNASDNRPDREERLDRFDRELAELGFKQVERIDLNEYVQNSIASKLSEFDAVHALGGNSYDLRESMRTSGFDRAIRDLLGRGLVYSGDSAGAIVMGPSLAGFQTMDAAGPDAKTDGLGIVDMIIVPHNDSPKEKYRNRWPTIKAANPKSTILPLDDNQVYIVDGERREVLSF